MTASILRSLREIAREVGCSHCTVSGVFSDARLPRWGLLELVVEAIGGDTGRFHALWLAASAGAASVGGGAAADAPSAGSGSSEVTGDEAAGAIVIRPPLVRPRQRISDVARFAGRRAELARLDALLPAPLVVISGTACAGKTVLAVHWGHRIAARALLDAFEVPPDRIPASVEAQVALYRSILAERRVLVLLDNARDASQVRPLLPGTEGCLTVRRHVAAVSGGLRRRTGSSPSRWG